MKKPICILALSGGIDSSVSLYLLQKQNNYNIIAIFMKNWDDFDNLNNSSCNWKKDFEDAQAVCNKYNIKLYIENFEVDYWKKIFLPMINDYKKGLVPNPDIFCNKLIKFGIFKNQVLKKYNAQYIATGHYCGIKEINKNNYLTMPKDLKKDQTYFLSGITEDQLSNVIFPLENYKKEKVYSIANSQNLPNINKKESTGICFIGEVKFNNFLHKYINIKTGNIVDFNLNKIIGKHEGIYFYTIGQRKRLKIFKNNIKYFVYKKDLKKNILYVLPEGDSKLFTRKILFSYFHFINDVPTNNIVNCLIKTKHTQRSYTGKLNIEKKEFILDKSIPIVSPGQYGVFYKDNICLGNGIFK